MGYNNDFCFCVYTSVIRSSNLCWAQVFDVQEDLLFHLLWSPWAPCQVLWMKVRLLCQAGWGMMLLLGCRLNLPKLSWLFRHSSLGIPKLQQTPSSRGVTRSPSPADQLSPRQETGSGAASLTSRNPCNHSVFHGLILGALLGSVYIVMVTTKPCIWWLQSTFYFLSPSPVYSPLYFIQDHLLRGQYYYFLS